MKTAAKTTTRGIMMFAHNNQEIDYLRLAVLNAYLIQKNLKLSKEQITIVTDIHSYEYAESVMPEGFLEFACSNYVFLETDYEFKYSNLRTFKDTYANPKTLPFYNLNRCDAYELSPYDETILIDADYLVLSNSLNQCWGHSNELMMNWDFQDAMFEREFPDLDRLNPLGITMYWATVVYFRKSDYCETFFEFVKNVRDNKQYYKDLYNFPGGVYRNDFSFSVAAHMLGGYKDKSIPQLPIKLYKSFDNDDIYRAEPNRLLLFLEKPRSPGDFMLCAWSGLDIHVMNKWALNRISNDLIDFHVENSNEESTTEKQTAAENYQKPAAPSRRKQGRRSKKKASAT